MKKLPKPPGNWTESEDLILRSGMSQGLSIPDLATKLNRRIDSTETRAKVLARLNPRLRSIG